MAAAEIDSSLSHVLDFRKSDTSLAFLCAISAFLNSRDVQEAKRCMKAIGKQARRSADTSLIATWYLNMAFLFAYEGNLKKAEQLYQLGSRSTLNPETMSQVEDFMVWVAEQEPYKYQVFYCLGYFNWKFKGDIEQAKIDFEQFMKLSTLHEFPDQEELVRGWLTELKRQH